jgi:signal transduction histidine kinase
MGSRTRVLLMVSLGGLLLLTAVTGGAALMLFGRIRDGEALLRNRLRERSEWLEQVRSGIYLSGTLARDYFAEPDGADAARLLGRLAAIRAEVNAALARMAAEDTVALRGEVATYWKLLDLMTEMARRRPGSGVDAYFRHQMAQRRETMLQIAGEIGAARERDWQRSQIDLSAMYGNFRMTFALALALLIGLGLLLAALTVRRLVRLEGERRALSAQVVAAQEQERRAIARELHDDIAQSLSKVLLDIGGAAAAAESAGQREKLEAVAGSASAIVDEVRRIALSLRPSMLDDLGLVPALEWQAREVGHRTGLNVQIQAEETAGDLPEAHRTCIYRVVQEALTNCVRHSGAGCVRIGLQKAGRAVSLAVEDDGKGFTPARSRGLGLLGMEERVAQLGGKLRVESTPGHGTTILAELPL